MQEAEAKIRRLPTSVEKARALLLLVEAWLPLDGERAFEAFAHTVSSLRPPEILAEMRGASFQFKVKAMGIIIGLAERDIMRMLDRTVSALTEVDPARTLLLLSQLENPPLRLLAQIAYARRHLALLKEKKAKLAERRTA